ncbi:MAG: hypothetical protein OSJ65_06880 [Bacilli bacterium]|nr:hypothetical protein [Bacilli bacterium]
MELSKRAIDELKSLRICYEQKEKLFDLNFIKSSLEIIESEDRFKGKIELIVTDDVISAEENNGKIYTSLTGIENQALEVLEVFKDLYTKETEYLIKNYFAMYTLIHESSHVWQDLGLDDDEVVNRFYALLNKRELLSHLLSRFGDLFSNERHANIDAHEFLLDIYDDSNLVNISQIFYTNFILYLYGRLSPTEKMQMMFLMPERYDVSSLSVMKCLEVGFPVDKDIRKKIDNELIREARGDIDFRECKKRILGITNGVKY